MTPEQYDAIVEQAKRNVADEVQRRVALYADIMAEDLIETEVERLVRLRGTPS